MCLCRAVSMDAKGLCLSPAADLEALGKQDVKAKAELELLEC